MKILKISVFFTLIFCQSVLSQIGNGAVGSALRFEQFPVDMSTGLPQISIPLYNMPTRSKDISVDLSVSYHPGSISQSGFRSGNCGRGWSLSAGGVIQRIQMGDMLYSFSFMGYSGKINLVELPGGNIATITENKGGQLSAESFFSTSNELIGVNFYDDKGYKYSFNVVDVVHVKYEHYVDDDYYEEIIPVHTSLQLTDIYDASNNNLVNYNFEAHDEKVVISGHEKHNTINMVRKITVAGYGTVNLDQQMFQDDFGAWFIYNGFTVKDFLGNEVKNIDFGYDAHYDNENFIYDVYQMISLTISGVGRVNPQSYNFYYHPVLPIPGPATQYTEGYDVFGYPNSYSKYCRLNDLVVQSVDVKNVINGVLEKVKYPTGGCVIYNFESNTYSYADNIRLDYDGVLGGINPQYYTDLTYIENKNNYNINQLTAELNTDFITNQTQDVEVYIKTHGDATPVDLGNGPEMLEPSFKLKNMTTGQVFDLYQDDNAENKCLGRIFILHSNNVYRIIKGVGGMNIEVSAYTMIPNANKFWCGGGIRIKNIAFFDKEVPQDYFYSGVINPVSPAKQTFYNYSRFDDPFLSSGSYVSADSSDSGFAYIRYSNVSVSDELATRRTEYTFYSPLDSSPYAWNFMNGKLKSEKVYNEQNVLQKETAISYVTLLGDPGGTTGYQMGWAMPSQVLTKEYLGSTLLNQQDMEYDNYRNLKKKTVATSLSSESVITNYYYHLDTNGNPYTTNRVSSIDHIEEFAGTTPLSTAKVEYVNSWTDPQGGVNTSYLPSRMLTAKGAGTQEENLKNVLYDKYGNQLETYSLGIRKSYIWGYNNTYIIAEINGVAYSSIPATLITAAQTASNGSDEAVLLTALDNLRNASQLSSALVTTTTYKPLVGPSTVTDPRGYRIKYEYDSLGRQKAVKDQVGNILTENIYNTVPQN